MGAVDNVFNEMTNIIKKNWFIRLFDSQDNSVSATTVFLAIITVIGFILLIIPAIVLLIEVYYNHTISTDLNGMAAYITAVVALFATGGITKAWTNWSNNKYNNQYNSQQTNTKQNNNEEITS